MMARPFVQAKKLRRVFDISKSRLERLIEGLPRQLLPAVSDVSFTIDRQETLALVGESGSGKSTIAKMTVGILAPTAGEIVIDGVSMCDPKHSAQRRAMRGRIQMIFQDPYSSLSPRWRARDIIKEPIRAFGLTENTTQMNRRVDELLDLVGLDGDDGVKYPHELSGGQRQRVAIARALASKPHFIVCDEPTSSLDVSIQAQVLNLMRELQDQFGLTYLLISHNLAVVRHMADKIGVMYLGRLVELAPAAQLFSQPRHPYTRMLLDAIPDLTMSGRQRNPVAGEIPNPLDPPDGCPFHPRCPFAEGRCRIERPRLIPKHSASVACHAVEAGRI
jgi:peptide/nickel transport system ATP-binding protein